MHSTSVIFLIAVGLAAPSFAAWGTPQGNWASAPANIALSQDGRNILETPEVAQARAAHLAALSQAQSQGGNPNDDGSYDNRWDDEHYQGPSQGQNQWNAPQQQSWNAPQPQSWSAPQQQSWNAPAQQGSWKHAPANIALSADGKYVLDTPEVAQARAAHLAAYSGLQGRADAAPAPQWNAAPAQQWNAAPAQQWNSAPAPQWNAAPAAQQWNAAPAQHWNAGAPAPVAETPEVAQARAAHFAAHASIQQPAPAQARWSGAPSWQNSGAPAQNWASAPSQISLSHDGQNVLDTPEVANAKAAHLAAHAAAASGAAPARHW